MNTRHRLTVACFLLAALAPGRLPAGPDTGLTAGSVEAGIGYLNNDAYRFGRYTGLDDQGAYFVGDIDARGFAETGGYWRARGTNLGLESRYLRLDGGILGRQQYYLEYDKLPNNLFDSGYTPYLGSGGNLLLLPPGFDINTTLGADLTPLEIETKRERLGLGASLFARRRWRLDVAVSHETKDGIESIGGAIAGTPGGGGGGGGGEGGGGGGGVVGNTTAALLADPVDYTTDLVDVSLQYAKPGSTLEVAYHVSLFENEHQALSWEDAFAPGSYGSMALAPDNEFHQLSLSGSHLLPYNSQLTGLVSTGRMTQDDDFQAYTVNPAIVTGALPRGSLDAEVWVTTVRLGLASRPLPRLRLNAEYRFDKRDNDTPVDSYDLVVADGYNPAGTVLNRPLSYDRNRLDLDANYRFGPMMSLRGGWRYDDMSRDYSTAEREDTRENTLYAKWKIDPHADLDLALYAEAGKRDGSNYRPLPNENPALRKYYLADRDQRKYGASIHYQAADNLSLGATADYNRDDYDNSEIGLTKSTRPSWTLDAAWQPRADLTTYAFYTRDIIKSDQAGSEAGTVIPDWTADFEDSVDTYGAGAKMTGIRGKWDVGADLVYTTASGEVDMQNLAAPGTVVPYPDLESWLTSLKLWTQYHYRRNLSLKLSYWYQDYSADDWSVDNLQVNSIGNLLLLGEDTQDYDVHTIAASVIYRF